MLECESWSTHCGLASRAVMEGTGDTREETPYKEVYITSVDRVNKEESKGSRSVSYTSFPDKW